MRNATLTSAPQQTDPKVPFAVQRGRFFSGVKETVIGPGLLLCFAAMAFPIALTLPLPISYSVIMAAGLSGVSGLLAFGIAANIAVRGRLDKSDNIRSMKDGRRLLTKTNAYRLGVAFAALSHLAGAGYGLHKAPEDFNNLVAAKRAATAPALPVRPTPPAPQ